MTKEKGEQQKQFFQALEERNEDKALALLDEMPNLRVFDKENKPLIACAIDSGFPKIIERVIDKDPKILDTEVQTDAGIFVSVVEYAIYRNAIFAGKGDTKLTNGLKIILKHQFGGIFNDNEQDNPKINSAIDVLSSLFSSNLSLESLYGSGGTYIYTSTFKNAIHELKDKKKDDFDLIYQDLFDHIDKGTAIELGSDNKIFIYASYLLKHESYFIFHVNKEDKLTSISYCDASYTNKERKIKGDHINGVTTLHLENPIEYSDDFAKNFIDNNSKDKPIIDLHKKVTNKQVEIPGILTAFASAIHSIPTKIQEKDNCVTKSFLLLARYLAFLKNPSMDYGFDETLRKTSGNGRDKYKRSKENLIEALLISILEKDGGVLKSESKKNPKLKNFVNLLLKRAVDGAKKKNIFKFNKDILSPPSEKRQRRDTAATQSGGEVGVGSKRDDKHTPTQKKVFNPAIFKNEYSINSLIMSGETEDLESYLSLKSIDKQIDINTVYESGKTILHLAAENGRFKLVEALLKKGALFNLADKEGCSALHLATENNHTEIVKALLNSNKKENKNIFDLVNAVNNNGKTALHLAASDGNIEILRILLDNEATPNLTDNEGYTALHFAAEKGHIDIAQALLDLHEKNLEPYHSTIDFENNEGDTHHTRIAKILLTYEKVKVNGSAEQEISPLSLAAQNNHVEFMKFLLEHGANIDSADKKGNTALHIAAENSKTESFNFLLDKGANSVLKNEGGKTANVVLEEKKASLRDSGGVSLGKRRAPDLQEFSLSNTVPLSSKQMKASLDDLLVAASALHNNVTSASFSASPDDETSAPSSASLNNRASASYAPLPSNGASASYSHLPSNGASASYAPLPSNGASASSLLYSTALFHHPPIINTQQALPAPAVALAIVDIAMEEAIKANTAALFQAIKAEYSDEALNLIRRGVDINEINANGYSVFQLAALYGMKEVVSHPIFSELNVINKAGKNEETALHIAAKLGRDEIVEILLQKKANVNAINKDRCTPLHMVAMEFQSNDEGYAFVSKNLIKGGANYNLKNKDGHTFLDILNEIDSEAHSTFVDFIASDAKEKEVALFEALNIRSSVHGSPRFNTCNGLIKAGANVNCINDRGLTPLLIVALEDSKHNNRDKFHLMNTLIEEGANVNAITPAGKTVIESLLDASPRGIDPEVFINTLYLLCEKGANVESIVRVPWKSLPSAKTVKSRVEERLKLNSAPSASMVLRGEEREGGSRAGGSRVGGSGAHP